VSFALLTHVCIEISPTLFVANSLGRALARLAHQHRALCSIQFGTSYENPHDILDGLLEDVNLDLSSIHILTNVPAYLLRIFPVLDRLPSLTAIKDTNHFAPTQLPLLACHNDMPRPMGFISLDLVRYGVNYEAWLDALLVNLTELSIIEHFDRLTGPYPRLRRLRLPLDGRRLYQDLNSFVPNLEQLALIWMDKRSAQDMLSHLTSLRCMPHLSHVELRLPVNKQRWGITRTTLTRTLLAAMMHARCWQQITCSFKPASIYLDDDAKLASLEHVRWHVIRSPAHLDTYRPHVLVSLWRRWVPGLRAKQVLWDLCLCV
jgi:hypothetical protein